ncbi:chemotaxis protein [Vibrio crassostreae]|uniref:chemotaxis protein n=1 Tax=Vibrio crassostreae TaxID=246167 RepID=UPI001B30B203|nr:chemotaxis protein [Vibrio crassostreae]
MKNILDTVDEKTNLVGKNRFEILLFNLGSEQRFGINVFKVKEVISSLDLSEMPGAPENVIGIANIRGESIPVVDLQAATGLGKGDVENGLYIVTEYNRQAQAFLVSKVDRIVNVNWADIAEPPKTMGGTTYVTAITKLEDNIIGVLDVERVLNEISPPSKVDVEEEIIKKVREEGLTNKRVLIVDDSSVARKQIDRSIQSIGYTTNLYKNGQEALDHLTSIVESGRQVIDEYDVIISDIEMPVMDGYTLTSTIRDHVDMKSVPVILHTSMSGVFNEALVKRVGADKFIAKFDPDNLSNAVIELIR